MTPLHASHLASVSRLDSSTSKCEPTQHNMRLWSDRVASLPCLLLPAQQLCHCSTPTAISAKWDSSAAPATAVPGCSGWPGLGCGACGGTYPARPRSGAPCSAHRQSSSLQTFGRGELTGVEHLMQAIQAYGLSKLAGASSVTGADSADFGLQPTCKVSAHTAAPHILKPKPHVYAPDHGQKLVCLLQTAAQVVRTRSGKDLNDTPSACPRVEVDAALVPCCCAATGSASSGSSTARISSATSDRLRPCNHDAMQTRIAAQAQVDSQDAP